MPESVFFIGLGNMGGPMATRLLEDGWEVRVYDAHLPNRDALVARGATAAESASDVGDARRVILMLPGSDVVEAVLLRDGLAEALPQGAVVIDMSSSAPLRTQALAQELAARGIALVDAPVSGGVSGAVNGELTVMVGGDGDVVAGVVPVLQRFGNLQHVGQVGAGHALKALNNLMSATHLWVTSESMLVAERFGLDVKKVLDVVNGSSGRSGSTQNKWPNFILPETFDSGFSLKLMLKDMRIAAALAHELGMPFHLGDAAIERWADAAQELPDDADHTRIAEWLRSASEVPAR